ncbi:hypothetical protein Tco_0369950, partial [Tanacetum coccineum]
WRRWRIDMETTVDRGQTTVERLPAEGGGDQRL